MTRLASDVVVNDEAIDNEKDEEDDVRVDWEDRCGQALISYWDFTLVRVT